ncbi:MAG: hypothetical protein AAGN46_07360 [Acidobacteriota bacterium]
MTTRWLWVLDVVFGATAALGFETLQETLRATAHTPSVLVKQIVVALSLYIFFLYDVSAVHILVKKYPYRVSFISGCRYLLDISMSFLLMMMLIPGVNQHPEGSTLEILTALTLWHACAFLWHVLANWEHRIPPTLSAFSGHFLFIAIYWLVFGVWAAARAWQDLPLATDDVGLLYAISITVAAVAIRRAWRIMEVFYRDPGDDDLEPRPEDPRSALEPAGQVTATGEPPCPTGGPALLISARPQTPKGSSPASVAWSEPPATFCVSVGSIRRGTFAWAGRSAQGDWMHGSDMEMLCARVAERLCAGDPVALGFECPTFVPLPETPQELGRSRSGEGSRPWSAGPGSGALATGLVQVSFILDRLRRERIEASATLDWSTFADRRTGLFLWEAFLAPGRRSSSRVSDAELAVRAFSAAWPSPLGANAIVESRVVSMVGTALLRTGWEVPETVLSEPCLVIAS